MAKATTPFNNAAAPEEPWGLWNVIQSGDIGGVERILRAYPDAWKIAVDKSSDKGFIKGDKAIHVAARGHKIEIIELLMAAGATLDERNEVTSETPLMASIGSTVNIPKYLIQKSADKKAVDKEGRTALHLAAFKGYAMTAGMMVELKLDPEARDRDGNTPLMLAVKEQHSDASLTLLKHGAIVNTPDSKGVFMLDLAFNIRKALDNEGPWVEIHEMIRSKSAAEKLKLSIDSAEQAAWKLGHGQGTAIAAPVPASFIRKGR